MQPRARLRSSGRAPSPCKRFPSRFCQDNGYWLLGRSGRSLSHSNRSLVYSTTIRTSGFWLHYDGNTPTHLDFPSILTSDVVRTGIALCYVTIVSDFAEWNGLRVLTLLERLDFSYAAVNLFSLNNLSIHLWLCPVVNHMPQRATCYCSQSRQG